MLATLPQFQTVIEPLKRLWGCLQPMNTVLPQIDFEIPHSEYIVGRDREICNVVLPGPAISQLHCKITWNGSKDEAEFTVHDVSTNGTYVNGSIIGRNETRRIYNGEKLAFSTPHRRSENRGTEDYRYEFKVLEVSACPKRLLEDHFYMGEDLGAGTFAKVRRVTERSTGNVYAAKVLQSGRTKHQTDARKRSFEREISFLDMLKHRNICNMVDVFIDGQGHQAILLEFSPGGNLHQRLEVCGFMDEEEGMHIAYQICDAVSYIHSKGVIHGDLKPDNILLSLDDPPIVKVADFGVSRLVRGGDPPPEGHADEESLAPEVSSRNGRFILSVKSDSWSLGVTVFYMLMGFSPFPEKDCLTEVYDVHRKRVDWNRAIGGSPEALNFMECLIDRYHDRRMSVTKALQHKWFKYYVPYYAQEEEEVVLEEAQSTTRDDLS